MSEASQNVARVGLALVMLFAIRAWAVEVASEVAPRPGESAQVKRPLWEFGLGAGALVLPDYRGSAHNQSYFSPLPYFIYRGTWLKADRDGTRALLFNSDRVELDISLGATSPTRSREGTARAGMPKLNGTVEVGPNLNVLLMGSAQNRWRLEMRLPVRAAFTLQSEPRFVGTTFSPHLNLDIGQVAGGWNIGLLAGPLFADAKNHGFFYSVESPYVTATRAAYRAPGGYSGWRALAATSRRFGSMWVGAFARYDQLSGAAFTDSPLVRRSSAVTLGVGVAWFFAGSSELVSTTD